MPACGLCATLPFMTRLEKFQKESLLLTVAVALMSLKIMAGVIIIHHMRTRANRMGLAFVEDDD